MTVGELKPIYDHIAKLDGTSGSPFDRLDDTDNAIIDEVRLTLEKLAKHYSKEAEVGGFAQDWKDE